MKNKATAALMGGQAVGRDVIYALPEPEPKGRFHKPLHHGVVLDAITAEIVGRGYGIEGERLALTNSGGMLFGVMTLAKNGNGTFAGLAGSTAFGFRTSTNQKSAIRGVAGAHVFVCDNMILSGEMFAICRKSTTGVNLEAVVHAGFDRVLEQGGQLSVDLERLSNTSINNKQAKLVIYNAIMTEKVVAPKLMSTIHENYFYAAEGEDVAPRSMWGLHNAFTRAIQTDISSVAAQIRQTVELGRFFQIGVEAPKGWRLPSLT